jgi:hypothetical protein
MQSYCLFTAKNESPYLKLTDRITIITECQIFWRKKDPHDLNINMFNLLQRTITDGLGGKPIQMTLIDLERANPAKKRVILLVLILMTT